MKNAGPHRSDTTGAGARLRGVARCVVSALVVVVGGLAIGLSPAVASATGTRAPAGFRIQSFSGGQEFENSCSDAVAAGRAQCLAYVRIAAGTRQSQPCALGVSQPAGTIGDCGAYSPAYLQSAYSAPSATAGGGETVAVVDAYDDPNAASDLATYRAFFGLPPCANGCFLKVNQTGGSTPPARSSDWAQEISVDLDMVSALCPNCHILLVEANSNSLDDLGAAVNEAVALGANVVSNSYGGPEYEGETADATSYYDHPGVAITVAAGDSGYGADFPASAPAVTAVGGTTLDQLTDTGSRDATETAWSGTASGCSAYVLKPFWQTDTGCAERTVADVAAEADPNTGVWVYDSYHSGPWDVFGGTSVAAPIIAAFYALAGGPAAGSTPASYPYADPGGLNDIVSGSDGSCDVSYFCTAGFGYDGPTGLGTPNGAAAFGVPSQTVAFTAPRSATVSVQAALSATASSGLAVTLSVDVATTDDACSLSGDTVDFLNVGSCVIDANQAGDVQYAAAPQVQQTTEVNQAAQTVSFTTSPPAGAAVGGATYIVAASASSGLPVTITIDPSSTGTCSLAGSTVSFTASGTCSIDANQPGNANYTPAAQVGQSFAVVGAPQTVSFTSTPPADPIVAGTPYDISASATSGLPVSIQIAPSAGAVCSLAGSTIRFTAVGTCTVEASQGGSSIWAPASTIDQAFGVTADPQTVSFTSIPPTTGAAPGSTYTVTASTSSGLAPSLSVAGSSSSVCALSGTTVTFTAAGTCTIDANQTGSSVFADAQAEQSIAVTSPAAVPTAHQKPASGSPSTLNFTLRLLHVLNLAADARALRISVRLTTHATLAIVLRHDAKTLATWHRPATTSSEVFTLNLPPSARKGDLYTLTITAKDGRQRRTRRVSFSLVGKTARKTI